jgi:hypothetical protein
MFPSLQESKKHIHHISSKTPLSPLSTANCYSRPNLHTLKQLINLLITQLLTQRSEHISQLASANVAITLLVKHLETADELLWRAGWLEAVGPVQDVKEGVEVDCRTE